MYSAMVLYGISVYSSPGKVDDIWAPIKKVSLISALKNPLEQVFPYEYNGIRSIPIKFSLLSSDIIDCVLDRYSNPNHNTYKCLFLSTSKIAMQVGCEIITTPLMTTFVSGIFCYAAGRLSAKALSAYLYDDEIDMNKLILNGVIEISARSFESTSLKLFPQQTLDTLPLTLNALPFYAGSLMEYYGKSCILQYTNHSSNHTQDSTIAEQPTHYDLNHPDL